MTTTATAPAETAGSSRPCNRCKDQEGTIDLRGAEIVCKTCFAYYVSSKAIKRLEALQRETSAPRAKGPRRPQRYLVGLSCGPSSTALLHVLTENVRQQRARGQKTSRFEYVAVHVVDDTVAPYTTGKDGGVDKDPYIAAFRARFPDANLQTVPLSSALELPSIDWTTLPNPYPNPSHDSTTTTTLSPSHRLSQILHSLPSTTSRADVRRLLTRHVLLAAAALRSCDALLLGHSTTSLAELTLSETAKGRGFAVPWLVNDGAAPLPSGLLDPTAAAAVAGGLFPSDENGTTTTTTPTTHKSLPVYSPLRELFRKELVTYLVQVLPAGLASTLLPPVEAAKLDNGSSSGGTAAVVSHRDLSIDDVLGRYFAEVEASYPSVVANVVRTTGKLVRVPEGDDDDRAGRNTAAATSNGVGREQHTRCVLCGAGLDELGDQRWRGEIGDDVDDGDSEAAETRRKLCYGCQRTIRG
ncbi:uncharacterized protein F4812DRAFT_147695 [Daldinia caldariorum]|uniref:uncharacterized protein n=1 Tax=Daldinia caldariorum TaxID=326644 RepID=UPI002008AA04|nr:uncharacterized protein F4812DRAFT_147695 [Daldinia caldariorum]KAI1465004.1 hypothetical protein F4812DRAFT_147695 [Daldinia caldariorum]